MRTSKSGRWVGGEGRCSDAERGRAREPEPERKYLIYLLLFLLQPCCCCLLMLTMQRLSPRCCSSSAHHPPRRSSTRARSRRRCCCCSTERPRTTRPGTTRHWTLHWTQTMQSRMTAMVLRWTVCRCHCPLTASSQPSPPARPGPPAVASSKLTRRRRSESEWTTFPYFPCISECVCVCVCVDVRLSSTLLPTAAGEKSVWCCAVPVCKKAKRGR